MPVRLCSYVILWQFLVYTFRIRCFVYTPRKDSGRLIYNAFHLGDLIRFVLFTQQDRDMRSQCFTSTKCSQISVMMTLE